MKDLFVNTQLPVVTSDRILYTPSNFARTSLLYLQEIGSLRVHKPNGTPRKLLDVSKATNLGWTYKTELEDGIRLAYEDFLNNPMRAER